MAATAEGFVDFFRVYAKSWVHAVAAAGLTAFGTLTFVHRGFAVLAIAAYTVPPIALYLLHGRPAETAGGQTDDPAGRSADARSGAGPVSGPKFGPGAGADADADVDTDFAVGGGDADSDSDADTDSDADDGDTDSDTDDGDTDSDADDGDTDSDADGNSNVDTGSGVDVDRGGAAPARGPGADRGRWTAVGSPTEATLFDVAITAVGACAVGDDGVVIADAGTGWRTVLEDGPAARGEDLRGVSATDDGEAVWVVGDSGAVGRIDAGTGRHVDHSGPAGRTDDLTGVAVAGASGTETVSLIDGSGQVHRGRYREGAVSWDDPVKPGGGSSLVGVEAVDESVAYCCDTNDGVYETGDGGETFDRIGLEADGTLTDVAAARRGRVHASADDGVVHRFDGGTWTPERVGNRELTAIARRDDRVVACDADGGVSERAAASAAWTRVDVGLQAGLEGVALSADRAVAVGDDGAIVERR